MRNLVAAARKFAFVMAFGVFVVAGASAQLSLRKALDYDADGKADYTVIRPSNNVWYISKSAGGFTFRHLIGG